MSKLRNFLSLRPEKFLTYRIIASAINIAAFQYILFNIHERLKMINHINCQLHFYQLYRNDYKIYL